MRRATLTIVATLLCLSWAAAEQAVNPPPRPLHKATDGHWTPYEQPTDVPADAELYVIQPGDTLWALAKKFLGDPYLWPQLWEKNKYIRDAHWIYPGDTLVVGVKKAGDAGAEGGAGAQEGAAPGTGEPAAGGEGGAAEAAPPDAEGAGAGSGEVMETLSPAGTEDDVYCFGYIDEEETKPNFVISSGERVETQEDFAAGDIVYLSGGEAEGVKGGQEFFAVRAVRQLRHPGTRAELGLMLRYVGHLRVLCTQDHTATAEVLTSCDSVPLGAWVVPFEPLPIPMISISAPLNFCDPASTKATGYIIYAKDDWPDFGMDHMVMIDLGEADQVSPGTILTIFRDNPVEGAPRLLLGEMAVMVTGQHWASARIFRSTDFIHTGDRVEVK